jgi:copper(I)-binding protein
MKSWLIALLCAVIAGAATGAAAQVIVHGAWVRATVPGQDVAGAYLKITSPSTAFLVGGSSPAAKAVELHEMSLEDNVMKMRPLARLELPAGKSVELKPGSYHLMLIDITRPLAKGDRVPLKLTVEDKSGRRQSVDVNAIVGDAPAAGSSVK